MPATHPDTPLSARRARLFRNGRNQAVRIPREFELAADEVTIYREDGHLVVVPVERSPSLAEVLSRLAPLGEDFPDIADPPSAPEEFL
ncbi:MAG: AbrB/MazE/SpoVT family DNA-binding domain-containing protein [Rhodospirillaceae bacterium]|nr:AbrB/MazE/SpoVT family DNA-binding domain-containing protein [Rhodospirillaceae bacterium]MYG53896.1 AbrB/MazE/SpoVT family DNA-binding domain-containing protein [Rhodospirillaceae bacterium]